MRRLGQHQRRSRRHLHQRRHAENGLDARCAPFDAAGRLSGLGELVINDFLDGEDYLIVVDMRSGELVSRVGTGSRIANGMFLTPGTDRDVYYCSTCAVVRVQWRDTASG